MIQDNRTAPITCLIHSFFGVNVKSRGVQLKDSHRDLCTSETISEKLQTAQECPLNTPL